MVYFVCESCQETLKKNQVDIHASRCRGCWAVSCVDCSKVFEGDSYKEHTSCISEAEKYEKSVYKGPKGNKKRNPQEEWMDIIMEAASEARGASNSSMSNLVKTYLPRMADMGNVPRNEKKFKNFLNNSLRVYREPDQAELWGFLEKRRAALTAAAEAAKAAATPTKPEGESAAKEDEASASKKRAAPEPEAEAEAAAEADKGEKKKGKKPRTEEVAEEAGEGPVGGDVDLGALIKKIVKKAEGRRVEMKALRKAVQGHEGHGLPDDKKAAKKALMAEVARVGCLHMDDGAVVYEKKARGVLGQ